MTDPVYQRLVTQWLREQAAQMRYSQNASGYIIAEEWAELLEAHAALLASPPPDEPPPPHIHDLVTCSMRDPGQVVHPRRRDCQHEGPHLIAACGAFMAERSSAPPDEPPISPCDGKPWPLSGGADGFVQPGDIAHCEACLEASALPDEPEAHPKRLYTREEVLSLGVDKTELDNMTKEQT